MNNFENFQFRNAELSEDALLPTHTKTLGDAQKVYRRVLIFLRTYSTVEGVLDTWYIFCLEVENEWRRLA